MKYLFHQAFLSNANKIIWTTRSITLWHLQFNIAINIYNKFCATGKGHNEFSNLIEVLDRHGVKYEYFTF